MMLLFKIYETQASTVLVLLSEQCSHSKYVSRTQFQNLLDDLLDKAGNIGTVEWSLENTEEELVKVKFILSAIKSQ